MGKTKDRGKRLAAPRISRKSAGAIGVRAHFDSLTLLSCSADHRIEDRSHLPKHFQITIQSNTGHGTDAGNQEQQRIVMDLAFHVDARHTESDEKASIEIAFKFRLLFKLDSGKTPTETQLRSFALRDGLAIAWPYATEFVHSISTRMGLPAIKLGVFDPETAKAMPTPNATAAE